jgi:hypothetical protein
MVQGSFGAFYHVNAARKFFHHIAHESTGENQWSIGQIIAPFAWVPLLVDIVYTIFSSREELGEPRSPNGGQQGTSRDQRQS